MNEKKIFDSSDAAALSLLLKPPEYDCGSACGEYSESWLLQLLEKYGSISAAAYAGCLLLAEGSSCKLSDGTALPDLQSYWLRLARLYRPNGGRCVSRADETPLSTGRRCDE